MEADCCGSHSVDGGTSRLFDPWWLSRDSKGISIRMEFLSLYLRNSYPGGYVFCKRRRWAQIVPMAGWRDRRALRSSGLYTNLLSCTGMGVVRAILLWQSGPCVHHTKRRSRLLMYSAVAFQLTWRKKEGLFSIVRISLDIRSDFDHVEVSEERGGHGIDIPGTPLAGPIPLSFGRTCILAAS